MAEIYVVPPAKYDLDDPDERDAKEMLDSAGPTLTNEDGSVMELIPACRKIVKEWQAQMVQGQLVDATSARAILTVYDALNAENRAHFEDLSRTRAPAAMAELSWKFIK